MFPSAIRVIRDNLQHVACRCPPTAAFADHSSEFAAQGLELRDFAFNSLEVTSGDQVCLAAITVGVIAQVKKRANFGDVEA